MAYEDIASPSLDDFTREQLRDLTESSFTGRIFRQLMTAHLIETVEYYDEELCEEKEEKHMSFVKTFEQGGRLRKVEADAWAEGSEESAELWHLCEEDEEDLPRPYASLPVRLIGVVSIAKAYGMRYPHMRLYQFFEISDHYSELDGSTFIMYQKHRNARDDSYQPEGKIKVLPADGARDVARILIRTHFNGVNAD
jgi:hypothetical protein